MNTILTTVKSNLLARVSPRSADQSVWQHEFIFNSLLLALLLLSFGAFLVAFIRAIITAHYRDESPFVLLFPSLFLLSLYWLSRKRFRQWLIILFLLMYIFLGTYALYSFGYMLLEGLVTYALVIVISGLLLSTKVTWIITAIISACLGILVYLQLHHISRPNFSEQLKILNIANVVLYALFFMVIILATWLSGRQLTQAVEQRRLPGSGPAAVEAARLQRLAEFGRISSSLLHDLANPLTVATLELDQLAGQPTAANLRQVRDSIQAIETYLDAARRQLRNEGSLSMFDVAAEISRVQHFLQSKVRAAQIHFKSQLIDQIQLYGDAVRFNQVMANLFANAIDAYETSLVSEKYIAVTMRVTARFIIITVEDQGTGISRQTLAHIFEPFYTTKQFDRGIGIGLAITKEVVEADFAGTITATSAHNTGTCFTLTLPLQPLSKK